MGIFKLNSSFRPAGDQPQAIERLAEAEARLIEVSNSPDLDDDERAVCT